MRPQMIQLIDKVDAVFGESRYPEFAQEKVTEIVKNSKVSQREKNLILKYISMYIEAVAKIRENEKKEKYG